MKAWKVVGGFLGLAALVAASLFAWFEANKMFTFENFASENYLAVMVGGLIYICLIGIVLIFLFWIISWLKDWFKEQKRKKSEE